MFCLAWSYQLCLFVVALWIYILILFITNGENKLLNDLLHAFISWLFCLMTINPITKSSHRGCVLLLVSVWKLKWKMTSLSEEAIDHVLSFWPWPMASVSSWPQDVSSAHRKSPQRLIPWQKRQSVFWEGMVWCLRASLALTESTRERRS